MSEVEITGPTLGKTDAGRHDAEDAALGVTESGVKYALATAGKDGPPEAARPKAFAKAPAGAPGRCRVQGH